MECEYLLSLALDKHPINAHQWIAMLCARTRYRYSTRISVVSYAPSHSLPHPMICVPTQPEQPKHVAANQLLIPCFCAHTLCATTAEQDRGCAASGAPEPVLLRDGATGVGRRLGQGTAGRSRGAGCVYRATHVYRIPVFYSPEVCGVHAAVSFCLMYGLHDPVSPCAMTHMVCAMGRLHCVDAYI